MPSFVVALGGMIFSCLLLVQCSKATNESEEKEKQKQKLKIEVEQKVLELASKYEADTTWLKKLADDTIGIYTLDGPYTLKLQRALVKNNGQPVVAVAEIRDVIRKNGIYYAVFENTLLFASVRFILSVDSSTAFALMNQPVEMYTKDYFAIVANITEVRKPEFYVRASPINEDETEIELRSSDTFLAFGKLTDFLFVADYDGSGRF